MRAISPGWPRVLRSVAAIALAACMHESHAADSDSRVFKVGVLWPNSVRTAPPGADAFWETLRERGYVDGKNLSLAQRWADESPTRLPKMAGEVLATRPDVIVSWGTPSAQLLKKSTSEVPVVAVGIGHAVGSGLVGSLARPGGNLTGLSMGWSEGLPGKWLELLQELIPNLRRIAVLSNPDNPANNILAGEVQDEAQAQGVTVRVIPVRHPGDLPAAFKDARRHAQAVVLLPDSMINGDAPRVTALAAKHRLPAIYTARKLVEAGGLISYGPDFAAVWRRAADYVDKILQGTQPGDLPIESPTRFDLAVNLRTAKALRLSIPESIRVRTDRVVD